MATIQGATSPAVTAEGPALIERGISLSMDFRLTTTSKEWVNQFLEASPSSRAIMLTEIFELFNDGVEGINLSFSEPKVCEH